MKYNCLIVDDEEMLAQSTVEYFNLFDVKSTYVTGYDECQRFIKENSVDIILLDINLENASGFDLCCEIRQSLNIPILFISVRSSDDDVIVALNIGGDDYIKKPYSLSVLLAKVKVVLRRYSAVSDKQNNDCFEIAGLTVDFTAGKVYLDENEIALKAMEYKLLVYLIKNRGKIIPKEELFTSVWGDIITGDGTLNVHIRHLSKKIEVNPNEPQRIKTAWGRGYVFEEIQEK